MSFRATVLTLFPEMFPGPLGSSLAGKALAAGIWSLEAVDIRDYARDRHRSVDDTPAGGGPGMVMRPEVLAAAIDAASPAGDERPRLLMSPRGAPLTQARVRELAAGPGAVIVCGRFEGVDERVIAARGLEEVSIGDYVLSGGEPAAIVVLDAVVRLLPGVMGEAQSGEDESFEAGLLEHPHYTRPRLFEGREIPEILLSGDHGAIARWRRAEAERITAERRPDLLARRDTKSGEQGLSSGGLLEHREALLEVVDLFGDAARQVAQLDDAVAEGFHAGLGRIGHGAVAEAAEQPGGAHRDEAGERHQLVGARARAAGLPGGNGRGAAAHAPGEVGFAQAGRLARHREAGAEITMIGGIVVFLD